MPVMPVMPLWKNMDTEISAIRFYSSDAYLYVEKRIRKNKRLLFWRPVSRWGQGRGVTLGKSGTVERSGVTVLFVVHNEKDF